MKKDKLRESFVSDDTQSYIPDPISEPSNARPADQMNGDSQPVGYDSNAAFMAGILKLVGALNPDQLSAVFAGMQSYLPGGGKDASIGHGRPAVTQMQASLNPNGGAVPQMPMQSLSKEAISDLFSDSGLTETFKEKAGFVFETAVAERVLMIEAELKDQVKAELREALEAQREDMSREVNELKENLDRYLDIVVKKWLAENEICIESGIKAQIGESVIRGLKTLAEDHAVVIDETTEDVLESLKIQVNEASGKYNELANSLVESNRVIEGFKRKEIISSACAGLTLTQIEKISKLAESAEFTSEDSFKKRIAVIKEQFLASSEKPTKTDTTVIVSEQIDHAPQVKAGSPMEQYVNAARKAAKS